MKYMLLMQGSVADCKANGIGTWPEADIKAHIAFMHRLNKELTASGELVTAQGLTGPDQARIVRANKDGSPAITDGPFPESKEFLAGFWIVDVDSEQRAYEIAARASSAPGPGGLPFNMPIHVQQVMSVPAGEL